MQELTFEQVESVSGGTQDDNKEQDNKQNDSWIESGSLRYSCCAGIDFFGINFRQIAIDVGNFLGLNNKVEQDQKEAEKELP